MVNIKNVLALRAFILKGDYKFDMDFASTDPFDENGQCIGGHAAILWPELSPKTHPTTYSVWDEYMLAEKLGISAEQQSTLCHPPVLMKDYSREQAVECLLNLAQTGEVRWQ